MYVMLHATTSSSSCGTLQSLLFLVNENHAYATLEPQCTLKYAESREQNAQRSKMIANQIGKYNYQVDLPDLPVQRFQRQSDNLTVCSV